MQNVTWSVQIKTLDTGGNTYFCERNTGKRVNEQDLTGHSEGFRRTFIYHHWFQMYFRMKVGRYEALQQMPVPRLRRHSSHYLTSPLDQRCHMLSSLFHNACPVCQITLGAGRHTERAIAVDVVVTGDTTSVLHNHRDWLMSFVTSAKIRKNFMKKGRIFFSLRAFCVTTLMPSQQ